MKYNIHKVSIGRPDPMASKVFLHLFSKGFHATTPLMPMKEAKAKLKEWGCKEKRGSGFKADGLEVEVKIRKRKD